jgi:uncharacterized membrane protein YeaQ/YmgE (transglycosylase-associated protein family)
VGIVGWIILGLLAGLIARAILPGDQPGGIIVAALVGIAGALIAGFVAQALRRPDRRVLRLEHVDRRDRRRRRPPSDLAGDHRREKSAEGRLVA